MGWTSCCALPACLFFSPAFGISVVGAHAKQDLLTGFFPDEAERMQEVAAINATITGLLAHVKASLDGGLKVQLCAAHPLATSATGLPLLAAGCHCA